MSNNAEPEQPVTGELTELELVVALYQQGQSAHEVGRTTGISAPAVNKVVRAAGVIRTPQEANRLASQRRMARFKIAKLDLVKLAERWLTGDEAAGRQRSRGHSR